MGTSKGYSPPSGPNWSSLKAEVTRATGAGLSDDTAARLMSGFLSAAGGASSIAEGSARGGTGRAARTVSARAAAFLGGVADRGVDEAFAEVGIVGWTTKSPQELRALLLDSLSPEAGTQDESDARTALAELLAEAIEGAQDAAAVAEHLARLAAEGPLLVLARYAALYVYAKFRKTFLEYELQKKGRLPTNQMLADLRRYLRLAAERMARSTPSGLTGDWRRVTARFTTSLLKKAFAVFGGEPA